MIRVIVTDDHPVILDALRSVFKAEHDIEVVACCRSGAECVQAVTLLKPDVVVLDLSMPGMSGLEVIGELNEAAVRPKVVLWTAAFSEEELMQAIRSGVHAVVLKQMTTEVLTQTVRRAAASESWIDHASIRNALEHLSREGGNRDAAPELTPREHEVVRLLSRGLSTKQIARLLSISSETVKTHIQHTYDKLRISTRAELAMYAREKGLV